MSYDETLKKKIEELKAYKEKINYSEEELAKLIETDMSSLIQHLGMKFPDKLSQIAVLAMLIEFSVRFKFEVDLALLSDELYKLEEEERRD